MASPSRRRFLHFSWNAARYALGPLGGMLVPWIVIHHSGRATWGGVVSVMIVVQLTAHLLQWGSKDLLLRAFARQPTGLGRLVCSSLTTRSLLLVPAGVVLALLPSARPLHFVLAWVLLLFVNGVLEAPIVWLKRFRSGFVIDLAGLLVTLVGTWASPGLDVHRVIAWSILGQAVRTVLLLLTFGRSLIGPIDVDVRFHLLLAIPFLLIGLSGLLGSRTDLYTLNALLDHEQVGVYQVVAGLFVQFQAAAALISTPFTRELYRMERGGVQRATRRSALVGALGLPFMLIGAALLFRYAYHFDLPWTVLLAGALITWPAFAYVPLVPLLYRQHREQRMVWANFGAAAMSATITFLLVPCCGIVGALFAAAAGQWLVLLVVRISTRHAHPMP